jgi:hypothetical protein
LLLLEIYNAITLPYTRLQATSYSAGFVVVSHKILLLVCLQNDPFIDTEIHKVLERPFYRHFDGLFLQNDRIAFIENTGENRSQSEKHLKTMPCSCLKLSQ